MKHCILCNSHNINLYWQNVRGYQVNRCNDCTFLFLDAMPDELELEKYYSEDYFMASYVRSAEDLVQSASNAKILEGAKEFANLFKVYSPNAKYVAEIGCSWGYLLWSLRKLGYDVKGYELSKATADSGREKLGLDITSGFFEPQPNHFDVIILRHVLEHVHNPKELLEQIYISLRENGLFLLEGPNLDSISSKIFGKNVSWVAPPDHVSFPNFRSIVLAGEKIGFYPVYKSTRRGRGISIFHQALLNGVALFLGGKEKAKRQLGGIGDPAPTKTLGFTKKIALSIVSLLDLLSIPTQPFARNLLIGEEMLILFKKKEKL